MELIKFNLFSLISFIDNDDDSSISELEELNYFQYVTIFLVTSDYYESDSEKVVMIDIRLLRVL